MTHQIQVGNKSITLTPTNELLAGILTALDNYADNYTVRNLTEPTTTWYGGTYAMKDPYMIGWAKDWRQIWRDYARGADYTKNWSWSKYLNDTFKDRDQRPINIANLGRYSLLLPKKHGGDYIRLYTFDTLEFLQGLISGIKWAGLDPHQTIFLLHEGETSLDF